LEGLAPYFASGNIAVSRHTAERLRAGGLPGPRVSVVPNPVDLPRIDPIPASGDAYDVVFAGRLIEHKRVDRFLAALAHLRVEHPKLRAAIVGSGPDEARLRALAHGLGLNGCVDFTGALADEHRLIGLLKSSRLFASASEREGFGIAALEAMACRVPVVACPGPLNAVPSELVLDGYNGRIAAEPRARALAACLGEALADEAKLRRMGANARRTAEGYDLRLVAPRLERAYLQILDRAAEGPAPLQAPAPLPAPTAAPSRR
jgi:glycosyltransferase involved in cell wall biosynthesis